MLRIYCSRQQSFADLFLPDPFLSQPELKAVYEYLDPIFPDLAQPLVAAYLADRRKRRVDIRMGRATIPLECVLRLILLKFLHKNCTYEDVELRASTDLAWKAFAKLSFKDSVPEHTTLIKWADFFGEEAFRKIHEKIVLHLHAAKVLKGAKVRFDTTAREANIHYPTDASLLGDAVRVITRTVTKIKTVIKERIRFRDRSTVVKRSLMRIGKFCRSKTASAKALIRKETAKMQSIAATVAAEARKVVEEAAAIPTTLKVTLTAQINLTLQLVRQTSLVLQGITHIPDRIVSVFQPHMRPIVRGKFQRSCEFGMKLLLGHGEHDLVTDYLLLRGNPPDNALLQEGVNRHARLIREPREVGADRGFSDPEEEARILKAYPSLRLSIPRKGEAAGHRKRTQNSRWFTTLQRWRAGQEAAIGVKKRCYGLGKSRAFTERGFAGDAPCGIMAYNLRTAVRVLASLSLGRSGLSP